MSGHTDFGLHITFEDRWERDLEDMIRRDYNHPSIIIWSTGNEVEERTVRQTVIRGAAVWLANVERFK